MHLKLGEIKSTFRSRLGLPLTKNLYNQICGKSIKYILTKDFSDSERPLRGRLLNRKREQWKKKINMNEVISVKMHNQYIFCVATPEKGPPKEWIAQSLFTFKEVGNHHTEGPCLMRWFWEKVALAKFCISL